MRCARGCRSQVGSSVQDYRCALYTLIQCSSTVHVTRRCSTYAVALAWQACGAEPAALHLVTRAQKSSRCSSRHSPSPPPPPFPSFPSRSRLSMSQSLVVHVSFLLNRNSCTVLSGLYCTTTNYGRTYEILYTRAVQTTAREPNLALRFEFFRCLNLIFSL